MKKRYIFLGFALLILALNLHACRITALPVQDAVRIDVLVSNRTPLGQELDQKFGAKTVDWCNGNAKRCSDKLYLRINTRGDVDRIADFVNARPGFWEGGAPYADIKLRFYDAGGELVGRLNMTASSFYRGGFMAGGIRSADRHEVKELLGYLSLDPLKIWDKKRR